MSKRFFLIGLSVILAFSVSGCTKVKDLTEEETYLIAEYAADLLLKYDLNYKDRIEDGTKATAKSEEATTDEEVTTEATTEADSSEGQNVNEVQVPDESAKPAGSESDIAKIIGLANASIAYQNYKIVSQYPEGDGEELVSLEAEDGYQLMVVNFQVSNLTEDSMNVSLFDKALDYRLVCNGNKAAKPMLTILIEDLETLDVIVNPGEPQNAVLIFQISDSVKSSLENAELYIEYEGVENKINIL